MMVKNRVNCAMHSSSYVSQTSLNWKSNVKKQPPTRKRSRFRDDRTTAAAAAAESSRANSATPGSDESGLGDDDGESDDVEAMVRGILIEDGGGGASSLNSAGSSVEPPISAVTPAFDFGALSLGALDRDSPDLEPVMPDDSSQHSLSPALITVDSPCMAPRMPDSPGSGSIPGPPNTPNPNATAPRAGSHHETRPKKRKHSPVAQSSEIECSQNESETVVNASDSEFATNANVMSDDEKALVFTLSTQRQKTQPQKKKKRKAPKMSERTRLTLLAATMVYDEDVSSLAEMTKASTYAGAMSANSSRGIAAHDTSSPASSSSPNATRPTKRRRTDANTTVADAVASSPSSSSSSSSNSGTTWS